ncbi:MAG TPA: CotH kinase family protein [Candidatus Aquilonibacter sp.]|nr:CotH kinase family protein [Candidatus Aquilonibacter sp.]
MPRETGLVLCMALALTGCGSGIDLSGDSRPPSTPDTGLSVVPAVSSLTIYPGSTQTLGVQVGGSGTVPVVVSIAGLPSGITVASSPSTVLPGGSVTLTLTASANADAEAFPGVWFTDPNYATTGATVGVTDGDWMVTAPLTVVVSLSNPTFLPSAAQINLPILNINTDNVPIVSKTTDVSGTISITSADGSTTYLPGSGDTDNTATFHVHGNSTAQMPKLPYEMKLGTSVDLLSLLGVQCGYVNSSGKPTCDKSKTYVLLANYDDKSLLHDWAASALANAIPYGNGYLSEAAGSPTPSGTSALMPWAPHSIFVELYLNGQYEGNYQLIEKVNADSHRVNIPELTEADTSGDVSGGYLMEIDQEYNEPFMFLTPHGLPIGLIDPDFSPDPEVPAQTGYITRYVANAENALFGANYTDPQVGWRAYFDEASLVNFYIVNDVMGNVDGGDFYSSDYLYKTVDNPLLYMGPVWDFDIAAGNVNYQPIVSPTVPWMQEQALWYKQLFTDPSFAADVQTQWNALKNNGVFTNWISSIQEESTALTQSAQNNFTRWPMIGETVWPNPSAADTYAGSVAAFTGWVDQRIGYLDSVLNGQAQSSVRIVSGPVAATKGDSVTYAIHVGGASGTPTGKVRLLLAGSVAGSGELNGAGDVTITTTAPSTGNLYAMAVYDGDRHYAMAQVSAPVPSSARTSARQP